MSLRGFRDALVATIAITLSATLYAQPSYLTHESPSASVGGGNWSGTASGDLNNDGREDFVMVHGQTIYSYLTTSTGNIGVPVLSSYFGVPVGGVALLQPVLADFNLDGILDLVAFNGLQNQQRVFFGVGNGAFTWVADMPAIPLNGIHHRVGDLNNDGIPEIVVWSAAAQPAGRDIFIFTYSPSTVSFLQVAMMTVPLGPPYLVDVNGDGLIDFMGFRDVAPATVSVYLGNGNFGYAHALDIPVPLPPAAPSQIINSFVGDLDLDGRTDIVLSMYPSGVYFPWIPSSVLACTNVLSSPTWTSTPSPGIRSRGYFFNEMFVRDINGDGFPDVVGSETGDLGTAFNSIPKTRVGALIGNGAGGFSSSMVIEVPGNT
ncbi:MAG TPA: VCBS repeat-containing protein, partial [Planctomycetota bacterium]|nr:VCBS repeat-containing protein [Planctomycetota bacterium]